MEEIEFDFSYIFGTIWKWILLILFFMILGLGGAFFYNYTAPIKYESSTSLYVQPKVLSSGDIDYEGILSNQRMVKTYKQIIKSRKIFNIVKSEMNLNITYEDYKRDLEVTSLDDTEIISITVQSNSPETAKDIANKIASVFIEEIKITMEINNLKVIDEAVVKKEPVLPRTNVNYVFGAIAGLTIGLILVFFIESMNHKIKNHEDVKKYLNLKTLGVVPHNYIDQEVGNKKTKIVTPNKVYLKIINDPRSVISESIRMIRTNINFMDLKVINVTSTLHSEGKTEFLTNVAVSFAMLGKKVLIIDCDLRKPKVHRSFGLMRKEGVSDLILSKGTKKIVDVAQTFHISMQNADVNIDILAAGSKISNPAELVNGKAFSRLVECAKQQYDLVLIDCPPISTMADGIIVSKLCDGTVYVIESDRTDRQVINSCLEQLRNNKVFVLGAVLTKVDVKYQKKLYGYKYDYYYSDYTE